MKAHFSLLTAGVIALAAAAASAQDYTHQLYNIPADGQFTADGSNIHYWNSGNYQIFDTITGNNTVIGAPDNIQSNGYGDPFGVYDKQTGSFYAATYANNGASYIYKYNASTGTWNSGTQIVNAYGGATVGGGSNRGSLYVSGLNEPWDGGYGQDTFISRYNETGRHDMLVETSGNSAPLAVDSEGNVYYGTFGMNAGLYKWTADQIASVTNDVDAGEEDTFLTLSDGEQLLDFNGGGGNGVTVDSAGNIFFAVNMGPDGSYIAMLDPTSPTGFTIIFDEQDYGELVGGGYPWFGNLTIDGDFLAGDTLYFSPYGSVIGVTYAVPEPALAAVAFTLGSLALVWHRRRNRN